MDDHTRRLVERYWEALEGNDFPAVGSLLHEEYVLDWPQSGERIRGRGNFVAVNEHFPAAGPWRFTVHCIPADGPRAVSGVTATDGARVDRALSFFEVRDSLIRRMTEYWSEPSEAPAWRAQ